jgi:biotin carboxylase
MDRKPHILVLGQAESLPDCAVLNGFVISFIGKDLPPVEMQSKLVSMRVIDVPNTFDVEELDSRVSEIECAAQDLIALHGPLVGIVATSEPALLPGAMLREKLGLHGLKVDKARVMRDKFLMKEALKEAGYVDMPAYSAVKDGDDPESLLGRGGLSGFPMVLKPRRQAASWGVHICKNKEHLAETLKVAALSGKDYEIEEFIQDDVIHIDGLVRAGKLAFVSASRYVFNCLQWAQQGTPMASVLIDNRDLASRIVEFTAKTTEALDLVDNVFHLEAFLGSDGTLRFLEIAGRPGGAGIVPTIRMVYGVDLNEESLRCDLGLPSQISQGGMLENGVLPAAGWAVTPLGCSTRCKVRGISGLDNLPEAIHHAEIPAPGRIFNAIRNEGLPSGKFYFKAGSASHVVSAIHQVVSGYRVKLERF